MHVGLWNILKSIFNQMNEWSDLMSNSYDPMTERNIKAISNLKCISLSVCNLQLLKRTENETSGPTAIAKCFVIDFRSARIKPKNLTVTSCKNSLCRIHWQ